MRRLYLQIYVTVVGIVILFGLLAALAWWAARDHRHESHLLDGIGAVLGEVLPPPGARPREVQILLDRLARRFAARITVRAPDGRLLGAIGKPLPSPPPGRIRSGWIRAPGRGPVFAIALPDSRWVVVRPDRASRAWPAAGFLAALALLAGAIAIGAYPLARRLTGRLERLQGRVDALGGGDLSARVAVEGRDEVAALAQSFNHAAETVQGLVEAQKGILASASHELRSPLARIRMAVELLRPDDRPELRQRLIRDIAELDDLIEELLLASRVDDAEALIRREDVDLLGLAAEEAARHGATVTGAATTISADPRLMRRLMRNLLDNAARYGAGGPVTVEVAPAQSGGAVLRVLDRGPGIPEEEREAVFRPFYRRPGMREGTDKGVGLGLALVRRIARRHNGDAHCRPRAGGGTCFEVTLGTQ
ncbi:MAG: HAMP domain-containing sensor histidine kinase [Alphaproteobacteria bacterium]|jgi:signal transduction histidine kinase|nr:HAMP domain-containing sensor histidine kinase [Alphaproteobacteria bacterium]MDP6515068.1 HAMP domain-containing sensor histidine kinase [Alphaproteobacteria bacterium]